LLPQRWYIPYLKQNYFLQTELSTTSQYHPYIALHLYMSFGLLNNWLTASVH
jgi:hypothetical protein